MQNFTRNLKPELCYRGFEPVNLVTGAVVYECVDFTFPGVIPLVWKRVWYSDSDTAILSKVERGERKASKEQILKLANILDLNEQELLIHYLSEKMAYELVDEDVASQTLRVTEERVKYLKSHKNE